MLELVYYPKGILRVYERPVKKNLCMDYFAILLAYSNVHNIVTNSHGAEVKQYGLNKSLNRDLNKVVLF